MSAGPRYTRHVRQFDDFTDSKYQQVRQNARPGCFSSSPIKSPLGIIISMKEQAHSCPARAPYRSDFFGFGIQSRDPWAPRSRNLETKQCLHFTTVGRV